MKKLLAPVAIALLAAGCATDPSSSTEPMTDKEYRTGSNIPERTRAGVRTVSPEAIERERAMTTGTLIRKPTGP
jgi:hypothetical protein